MKFLKKIFGQRDTVDVDDFKQEDVEAEIQAPAISPDHLGVKFVEEYARKGGTSWGAQLKLEVIESWAEIKSQPAEVKASICLWACSGGLREGSYSNLLDLHISRHKEYNMRAAEQKLGATLLRSKLPFTEDQLSRLIDGCVARRVLEYENPVLSVLGATERILNNETPGPILRKSLLKLLTKCRKEMQYSRTASLRKLETRIEAILDPESHNKEFQLPKGDWATLVMKDLNSLPEHQRRAWNDVFAFAATNKGAKPSQKWLKSSGEKLDALGRQQFRDQFSNWIEHIKIDPERPDPAVDLLKGLVWLTTQVATDDLVLSVGRFAQNCFVKVPGVGARSVKLGNACCVALMNIPDNSTAIAELVRLRGKIKYPSVRKSIQSKLEAIAESRGTTVSQLEDSSLPRFGFDDNGRYAKRLGDFIGSIEISKNKAVLSWVDKNGKPRKTVPSIVRSDFKTELAELKRLSKDVSSLLAGQIISIEQSYINDRSWVFAAWEAQYLTHPIRRKITQTLLWVLTHGTKSVVVLPTDQGLEDLSGRLHKPSNTHIVKLWHPLFEDTKTIVAWRGKIEAREVEQAFKQAHREIYVVTDAERQTEVYSNRFAAHILRQHQFRALCNARGWTYTLQGMWDSWNIPQKRITAFNVTVEFAVEMVADEEQTAAGIPLYLSSDQVRFISHENIRMNIEDVPAIVFSETMRDVDLFVAVTSVANDPAWTDGGPDGRFGTYWQNYTFGDLGETAKTRKELIERLVPKLAIAQKLEVTEKFLKVKGTKHDYNIHFGSGNIMIMPGNKYLCIVRASDPAKTGKIHLPFAGDNLLSIILSKAHMLVNDDKITDRTILSQLR